MKVVTWTRDTSPELNMNDDGNYEFEDSPLRFNLELGDQVQLLSFIGQGTVCFFVIDVYSEQDFDGVHNPFRWVTISNDYLRGA